MATLGSMFSLATVTVGRPSTFCTGRKDVPVEAPTTPTKARPASTVRSRLSWKLGGLSSNRSSSRRPSSCSTRADSEGSSSDSEPGSPGSRTRLPACSSTACASPANKADSVIIFDWDDTFLPTSLIRSQRRPRSKPLCMTELAKHAKLVEKVLRAARAVSHVSIVTLSKNSWVPKSAERFLPGVDFPALFEELNITVHYAQEEEANCPGAVAAEDWVRLKRSAMQGCINAWSDRGSFAALPRPTIISIGDSDAEQKALQSLSMMEKPLRKTLKLMDEPTLDDLSKQLVELPALLGRMVIARKDFDISLVHPAQLVLRAQVLGL